jgi:excisionase family DNA binding protein
LKRRSDTPGYELPQDVMIVPEVAAWLRCHPSTIYRMLYRGQIPHFYVASEIRFRVGDLLNWIAALERLAYVPHPGLGRHRRGKLT